jgi:hypothetical protein
MSRASASQAALLNGLQGWTACKTSANIACRATDFPKKEGEKMATTAELSVYQQKIVDTVTPWIGASLLNRGQELREFISRGVDDPRYQLNEHISSCGLFALAVWHAAGVKHELLKMPYQTGKAI